MTERDEIAAAEAVLAQWDDKFKAVHAKPIVAIRRDALAAMIALAKEQRAELARLKAPLGDEGRELVASAQWWFRDYDGTEAPDGAEPIRIPCCGELRRLLTYIERQAAALAAALEAMRKEPTEAEATKIVNAAFSHLDETRRAMIQAVDNG